MSAVLLVYSKITKFAPRQQVLAFVSHSLNAVVGLVGCKWFAATVATLCCVWMPEIRRVVLRASVISSATAAWSVFHSFRCLFVLSSKHSPLRNCAYLRATVFCNWRWHWFHWFKISYLCFQLLNSSIGARLAAISARYSCLLRLIISTCSCVNLL